MGLRTRMTVLKNNYHTYFFTRKMKKLFRHQKEPIPLSFRSVGSSNFTISKRSATCQQMVLDCPSPPRKIENPGIFREGIVSTVNFQISAKPHKS